MKVNVFWVVTYFCFRLIHIKTNRLNKERSKHILNACKWRVVSGLEKHKFSNSFKGFMCVVVFILITLNKSNVKLYSNIINRTYDAYYLVSNDLTVISVIILTETYNGTIYIWNVWTIDGYFVSVLHIFCMSMLPNKNLILGTLKCCICCWLFIRMIMHAKALKRKVNVRFERFVKS